MSKRTCNKVPQQQFAELILKLNGQKEALQERFHKGLKSTTLARDYGIPVTTIRAALKGVGIDIKREKTIPKSNGQLGALISVVTRIAKELNISCDELKPYAVN